MGRTAITKRGTDLTKLTDRQQKFVFAYMESMDAKQAAIAAGYGTKNARHQGAKLLRHWRVKRALGKLMGEFVADETLTIKNVLQELAYCLSRNVVDFLDEDGYLITDDLRKLPLNLQKSIEAFECRQIIDEKTGQVVAQEFKVTKMVPKDRILTLAMKYLGLLVESNTINNNNTIVVDWDKLLEPPKNGEKKN